MTIKEQIINIPILKTTLYAQNAIEAAPIVMLHSRYNKTINLLINNQIFTLQPKESELSPISLITDFSITKFQQLSFQPNQPYRLNLNYSNDAIFSSKLTACTSFSLNNVVWYANLAQKILQKSNAKGLNLLLQNSINDVLLRAFKQYLVQAEDLYQLGELEKSAEYFTKLIGLGIGLTPSGDDFLCGFIATFQYFTQTQTAFYQTLTQKLQQHLDNTNAISRRFLDCALQQQFSAPLLSFFNHTQQRQEDFRLLAQRFENIGHSSGMDTLFGIYHACKWLLKKSIIT
ncbi:Protein of uncharacterised function (DUF2877) [Mannheimia haemolytica]|uniref:Protein of uncharacterized function (DUF2877) n=2 Tax=Mannheimia haemolytica TaxID=75985 RepID=A0A448TAW3_MANHA|nr:Protein of uncharacterised function (DUF2877) [Mannheimia haemolytica]HDV7284190.1 DUF2877 domain-containing protein [Mannheimia haemolytica]